MTKQENMFLFVCSETVESKLAGDKADIHENTTFAALLGDVVPKELAIPVLLYKESSQLVSLVFRNDLIFKS